MTGTSEQSGTADAVDSGLLVHSYSYFSAHVNSDGSFVHSGPKSGDGYRYIAPDGASYTRSWWYYKDGSPTNRVEHHVTGPVVNGKRVDALTVINHVDHTYSQHRTPYPPTMSPILHLASSPFEVRQALQRGQVTQQGTTTVQGTPALAILVADRISDAHGSHLTLYVDARTYQPLRTVSILDGNPTGPQVADRMPATPDNIAKAKHDDSIPAGYTKVDWAG